LFVTFEGLDGCGKTTQIRLLAGWFDKQAAGYRIVLTRQPGGTATGDKIRSLVLDSRTAGITPMAEMALMFADRAQALAEVILPAISSGSIVICDRFTDSTEAYQGGGRELGSEVVLNLHHHICGGIQPDLTFLLMPSVEASLARARRRSNSSADVKVRDEGRFEAEKDAFFYRTRKKYLEIAATSFWRVVLIEGDISIEEVHRRIVRVVSERLARIIREA
jgi:dTMP kinase